jgi:chromosome segregation ATPase
MKSQLDSLSSRLGSFKQEIDGYKNQARMGLRVDESAYQRAIDNHNRLVEEYNALLENGRQKAAEYDREINSVNEMVRRYNQGER